MKTLFITLTIAAIFSQIPHAFSVFNSFSRLEQKWLKYAQSITFCGIISVAIFGFVIIGKSYLALIGAGIEVVINIYYYSMEFWKNGYGHTKYKLKSTLRFWRMNWIALFFAFLLPAMIFIFSEQLKGF